MILSKIKSIIIFFALTVTASAHSLADNIDAVLADSVPLLLAELREEHNVKVIAVLPFRFKHPSKEGEQFSGAIIQTNMANRIQNAMAMYRDPEKPVDIIFDALSQARKTIPDAHFLTEEKRKALFNVDYALPVGGKKVRPDALITGVIEASADWTVLKLNFQCCLKSNPKIVIDDFDLEPQVIKTDYSSLVAVGKGYKLPANALSSRGANAMLRVEGLLSEIEKEIEQDKQLGIDSLLERVGKRPSQIPFQDDPVSLTVKYDGQTQNLMKDSVPGSTNFTVNDPKEGQKVTFELSNKKDQRLGVVITVNGQSLSDGEFGDNPDAVTKFILEPNKTYEIPGIYQKDRKGYQPIVGLPESETRRIERKIPADVVGLLHMYIYEAMPDVTTEVNASSDNSTPQKPQQSSLGTQRTGASSIVFEKTRIANDESMGLVFYGTAKDGSAVKRRATGSFSMSSSESPSNSWEDLAGKIKANLISTGESGKGLMAGVGEIQPKEIQTDKLGDVIQTHAYIIRYFSVAQDGSSE
jgi:hypothetical protein